MSQRPSLNVRSMAKILHLPSERKIKLLYEQKYPKDNPQVFFAPYYSPAITGIRMFYRNGCARSELAHARSKAEGCRLATRRENNKRLLDSFERSGQSARKLVPQSNIRYAATISNIDLKLSADLRALENEAPRYLYYHCKGSALPGRLAEDALNIAHWVLEQNGVELSIQAIEFIDLFTGNVHRVRSRSAATEKALWENARLIDELWPTL
jgi:hypothetical protein